MFSRKKNKPLVLSLNDSNYAPAPNPNTLRPQAATGQKEEEPPKVEDPQTAAPMKQLANAYNEIKRPLPDVTPLRQKVKESKPKQPTIINNYYYVQAPPQGGMQPMPQMPQMPAMPQMQPQMPAMAPVPQMSSTPPMSYADQQQLALLHQQQQKIRQQQLQQQQQQQLLKQQQQQQYRPPNIQNIRIPSDRYEDSLEYQRNMSPQVASSPRHHHYHQGSRSPTHRKSPQRVVSSNSSISANDSYDSFVQRTNKPVTNSRRSPSRKESNPVDNIYQRDTIYSASVFSDDSRRRYPSDSQTKNMVARLPDIDTDFADPDSLECAINRSLINELMKLQDEDISVHNDQFFRFYDSCCIAHSAMTVEQLGSILYDPYDSSNRLSFKTLNIIMSTFTSNPTMSEMDFRNFVKMCKFIKGCFVSFNYHDKRGNDHVLDFEEFRKALNSNRIACSDKILAQIFQHSESLDFEQYVVAIILIRKNEKRSQ